MDLPFEQRLARKVQIADCWEWTGAKTKGYGSIRISNPNRHYLVHRWVWENLVGPIPDGLELDHRCRNRACCNPDHLEPVIPIVNQQRGASNWTVGSCKHGHPPEMRYWTSGGATICRGCRAKWKNRRLQSERAANPLPTVDELPCRNGHGPEYRHRTSGGNTFCKKCRSEYKASRKR